MLTTPLETLKQVIDQPSGSLDQEDVTRVAEMFAQELADLGFAVEKLTHPALHHRRRRKAADAHGAYGYGLSP